MVAHFTKCDEDFGRRVAEGIGIDGGALDLDRLVMPAGCRRAGMAVQGCTAEFSRM
jgi:hypothetical protein